MEIHAEQHRATGNDPVGFVGSVLCGLAADKPTVGREPGSIWFATDTGALSIWTGTAWKSTTLT